MRLRVENKAVDPVPTLYAAVRL